ncbi:MAG TPA: hypothetical protein PLN29_16510 [Ilumatobacteraceae bacterium]|nr:hypothetical protein [Ilumatobacteraceae bacterium]
MATEVSDEMRLVVPTERGSELCPSHGVAERVETVEQSAQPQDSREDSRAQPDHPSELVVEPGVRGADLDGDVADLSGRVGFDARDGVVHSVVGRVRCAEPGGEDPVHVVERRFRGRCGERGQSGVVDREMWRDRFETGDPPAKQGRSDTEHAAARCWAQHHPQGVGLGRRTVHDRLIVRTDDEAGASDEGLTPPGSCRLFDRRTEHERGDDRPGRGDQLTPVIDRAAGVPVRLDESRQRGTGASPDGDEARHLTTAASTDSSSAAGTAVTVA